MAANATPAPGMATEAVLVRSERMPAGTPEVRGYDFDGSLDFDALMAAFATTGFQGTSMAEAIAEVRRMISWRLSDEPVKADEDEELRDPEARKKVKCTIFLGFTSNMISCGVRDVLRFLCQHKMVDCIVTTGGGIEEDFMKCQNPHYLGDFALKGRELRLRGINRIGNLLVPNLHYCDFEDWLSPLLHTMHDEQEREGTVWTPSKLIHRLGLEINHPESVWYWAAKNDIPVFCPAITDGSLGDMLYFHSYKRAGFVVDLVQDIRRLNDIAVRAKKTGMLILGGGVVKHHICNANLMRNGADFSVFINTGQEFDGSDSGAKPDEAVSWGKIRLTATPVKVYADASLVFPLLVSQSFAKIGERNPEATAELRRWRAAKAEKAAEAAAEGAVAAEEDGDAVSASATGGGGGGAEGGAEIRA